MFEDRSILILLAEHQLKRTVHPSSRPGQEKDSLDFLAKQWRHDAPPPTHPDHVRVPHRSLTPHQRKEYFDSFSRDYAESHPAFARLSPDQTSVPDNSSQYAEMWTHRFRPRRANEVLGNEHHARYLRDWLTALELRLRASDSVEPAPGSSQDSRSKQKGKSNAVEPRGVKRPRVIRAVTRKWGNKKRRIDSEDELDDFVVFSDDEENIEHGPPLEESEDELALCQRTFTRIHRQETAREEYPTTSNDPPTEPGYTTSQMKDPRVNTDFSDNLTNTLIITGPPGCGKTAAVYACTEELGWEVFEVYSGIGRRNGANLDLLVGDVGRNHIIQTVQNHASGRPTKSTTNTNELGPLPLNQQSSPPNSSEKATPDVQHAESSGSKPVVRQSLVLLEEVDIIFKEDAGFWPAVIDLIRDCRRPVVLTCNDLRLVPLSDLPLQTVLVFEPCPSPVAATFLQCLSLTESCLVPREDLMVLYETTHAVDGLDIPDAPLYPRTEPLPLPDLRWSITQLQMLCASAACGSASEMLQGDEAAGHVRRSARAISAESSASVLAPTVDCEWLRRMSSHSDLLSHVDAQLCRSPLHTPEALSMASSKPSLDDELGHTLMSMPLHVPDALVFYHNDELIAQVAIRLSRGIHEEAATGPIGTSINPAASLMTGGIGSFRSRVVYQSQMADALQNIIQPPAPLMPQSSVFLDYIPWVRHMVTIDDILERIAWDGMEKEKSGRLTRNSMRTKHIRAIDLDEVRQKIPSSPHCVSTTTTTTSAGQMPASTTVATVKHDTKHLSSSSSDYSTPGNRTSQRESSRHSPVISLPPLDYLQQQRRGSLTDPSFHAASVNSSALRPIDGRDSSTIFPVRNSSYGISTIGPRPAANYVFGDSGAASSNSEPSSKQMRKILRSPSAEQDHGHRPNGKDNQSATQTNGTPSISDHTNADNQKHSPRINARHPDDTDYSSRRQSIANSSDSQLPHGTKRKMSSDREAMTSDEVDSQLAGPGIPSPMNMDPDGRAQKRRGSAVETHRIAQLSIYDHRRHSVHAGAMISGPGMTGGPVGNNGQWWLHERRDSLPAILPNTSNSYPSAFSGDQPHGRSPAPTTSGSMATFAWSAAQHPDGQQDPNIQNHTRSFESQPLPTTMMPPMSFPSDRRMSVPENAAPAVGPTRNMRSRSRPPSRQLREAAPPAATSTGSAGQTEESSLSASTSKLSKDLGSTPYSRSPELRVSHKLAERKRRKEMKDLFDELRDQLPADRGMKASKWEILSKAIDFVINLKQSHQDMAREIDMLRHELDSLRQGIPSFGPGAPPHPIVYGQGPVPYPPPPPGAISHPPQPHSHQPQQHQQSSQSRPSSSENAYSSVGSQSTHQPTSGAVTNGNGSIPTNRVEAPPT
ncbi:hypothetical protein BU15DRAFT_38841 [Melanogaster broomeanus]|nr:hypothetical protein BU15DRAFT_38841 [Melanogaster broomeanus]